MIMKVIVEWIIIKDIEDHQFGAEFRQSFNNSGAERPIPRPLPVFSDSRIVNIQMNNFLRQGADRAMGQFPVVRFGSQRLEI